jgi:hypothetical protein
MERLEHRRGGPGGGEAGAGVGRLAAAAGADHQGDDAPPEVGVDSHADGLRSAGPEQAGGGDPADRVAGGDLEDRGGALAGVGTGGGRGPARA